MNNHFTLMQKDGHVAFLSLRQTEGTEYKHSNGELITNALIGKMSEKENVLTLVPYNTRNEALTVYKDAVNLSVERGWRVVWKGEPNYG